MAKVMWLIFSLFNIASAQEVPFAILLHLQFILHGLTNVLLCVPLIFFTVKSVNLVVGMQRLPLTTEIICNFHSAATLIVDVLFKESLIRIQVHTAVKRVENEALWIIHF